MTCKDCNTARSFAQYNSFNPACIHCGARIIQLWPTLPITDSECVTYRRQSLKTWMDWGHDEAEIRKLAKGPLSIGPENTALSVDPIPKKPRLVRVRSKSTLG